MKLFSLLLVTLTLPVSNGALAQTEHRSVDAHVHGVAQLTLMQEGKRMLFEFISPAVNIVGFEHAPEDDAQAAQLGDALEQLESANSVLLLSNLDCELLTSQSRITGIFASKALAESIEHGHDHAHEDGHGHRESVSGHAGFEVNFELTCRNETTLSELTVTAFENFKGIEAIQAQWVLNGIQGARRLNSDSTPVLKIEQ